MSIKNILVALAPGGKSDPGRDFAISMASKLKGHVTGRAYALEPEVAVDIFDGVPGEILEAHRAAVTKEAEAATKKFEEAARRVKVEHSHGVARTTPGTAAAVFAREARVNDLSVVTQSAAGFEHVGEVFAEAAMFYSGRPVIVVPKKKHSEFSLDRVLIAWDGGAHAARAVAASMPLLALAKKLEVLVVGNKVRVQETLARDLVQNLDRHGFDVELTCRDEEDAAEIIAREAKVSSATLLVMGGYGHSKLGEWIFGGVTRFMLKKSSVPMLMAH